MYLLKMPTFYCTQAQATKNLPYFIAGWFSVYDLISATCSFHIHFTVYAPIYVRVTQDSSILWLPAQVHPIAAANEP